MKNRYYIKDNYIENPGITYDLTDEINYWNNDRIHIATIFQYYVYEVTSRLIKKYSLNRFLDIGCGPAYKVKKLIVPICSTIVLFDQPNIKHLALANIPNAEFYGTDLEKDDINTNQIYDIIICADVIEHLQAPEKCLNVAKRHMGSNSLLVLSTPERDNLRGKYCNASGNPAHVREWNMEEFSLFIKSNNFIIIKHFTVPQKLLYWIENILYKLFHSIIKLKSWNNCQVLICKVN